MLCYCSDGADSSSAGMQSSTALMCYSTSHCSTGLQVAAKYGSGDVSCSLQLSNASDIACSVAVMYRYCSLHCSAVCSGRVPVAQHTHHSYTIYESQVCSQFWAAEHSSLSLQALRLMGSQVCKTPCSWLFDGMASCLHTTI